MKGAHDNSEKLRETILDLERVNARERESRVEAEVLLSGLKRLSACTRKEEIFQSLLEVLRNAIRFENAFLLSSENNGVLRTIASSSPNFESSTWIERDFFERLSHGHPLALFDVNFVPEWSTQSDRVKNGTLAALHVPLSAGSKAAVLIFTHSKRGFFTDKHIRLSARFAPLAAQALANFNRILELEKVNSRLQVEMRVREVAEKVAAERHMLVVNNAKMAALGEMAGGVAHEINNPLAVITTLSDQALELLGEQPIDLSSIRESVETINKTANRIAKIVTGLRSFSRNDSNDPCSTVLVKRVIEDTVILCQEKFKRHAIQINIELEQANLAIECRPTQISQVILNLLSNACDAIQHLPERWVRISARDMLDKVEISITDCGKGIPIPIAQKLFQPFFTTKEIGKGTGLGLSISKGLIEGHGGELTVDYSYPNTRFVIRLPKQSLN